MKLPDFRINVLRVGSELRSLLASYVTNTDALGILLGCTHPHHCPLAVKYATLLTMNKRALQLGYYAALLAFIASIGFDVVQTLQVVGVLKFPADAISIYAFSLLIPVPFLLAMLALHHTVPDEQKLWTHAALLFTVIYTMYMTLNYVVQLATVIPMTLRGAAAGIRLLDQTPHSLFSFGSRGQTVFHQVFFVGRQCRSNCNGLLSNTSIQV